jgi:hypothetical protein
MACFQCLAWYVIWHKKKVCIFIFPIKFLTSLLSIYKSFFWLKFSCPSFPLSTTDIIFNIMCAGGIRCVKNVTIHSAPILSINAGEHWLGIGAADNSMSLFHRPQDRLGSFSSTGSKMAGWHLYRTPQRTVAMVWILVVLYNCSMFLVTTAISATRVCLLTGYFGPCVIQ